MLDPEGQHGLRGKHGAQGLELGAQIELISINKDVENYKTRVEGKLF